MSISRGLLTPDTRALADPQWFGAEFDRGDHASVQHLAAMLAASGNPGESITKLYAESLVLVFLHHLGARQRHSGLMHLPACPRLLQVLEFIDANIETKLAISTLAHIAQISPFHFARQFKASTGLTPHQYVLGRRVEKAMQLLADPNLTIAEVSNECGFASQAHLTTVFQRQLGITPKAYRAHPLAIGPYSARFDKNSAPI